MSTDLILKPSCSRCGSAAELYGSTCKHLTLCVSCGKTMIENRASCNECGAPITPLIREYNIRANSISDKSHFIGRFAMGLPVLKNRNENKWTLQKEGLQGREVTDILREKYKNKHWLLEDETGQFQYRGQFEGPQSSTYYLLMLQRKEFVAIPAGSWYNFNKFAQYKQLTLEEAEDKLAKRGKTKDGYPRWMMKVANKVEKLDDSESASGVGRGHKRITGRDDEGNDSDKGDGDDDEEGPRGGDFDFDYDDIEKGDDWEHEEIFTDDDEAVGYEPEEREDLDPEIPAPPEIKQDDEDEDEEGGGLSKSGKELKKLLGRANGLNDSDAEDDDDDDDGIEDDMSPVLAPKKEAPKEEPVDSSSPLKPTASGAGHRTPSTSKSSNGKRKRNGTPLKKVKTENEVKSVNDESTSSAKSNPPTKGASPPASSESGSAPPSGPITEDEVRVFLLQETPVTREALVAKFKPRLKLKEDRVAFVALVRRISEIQKTNGANYVVLRER